MDTERQYLDGEQARRLYQHDQTFRQLVDCMVVLIHELRLTPGEVRSAATFAAIVHESRYPKPVYLSYGYFDKAAQEEMLKAMQEPVGNVRIPTLPTPPVLKAPIGALSTERTEPLPATCCGCICHVCANGHDTGQRPHSLACHERVLGITPIPAPTPDAYPECPCKACQARRRKEEP